jgi:hypothetical protein
MKHGRPKILDDARMVSLFVERQDMEAMKHISQKCGASVSILIRAAIDNFLEAHGGTEKICAHPEKLFPPYPVPPEFMTPPEELRGANK